tara:strand:+ start:437 stop:691 length:255 start_codon:yes stop_codon:yes gene_type:complete
MTDWKKVLNLNSYEWWRNHRRVVTLGCFFILFGFYINPVVDNARDKRVCAETIAINNSDAYEKALRRFDLPQRSSIVVYCNFIK